LRSLRRGGDTTTTCIVNPRVLRELDCVDIKDDKANNARIILVVGGRWSVVGGGCAGMEAARRAAFSGHKVILCESKNQLGGQIKIAESIPVRHEIGDIIPWYEGQLKKLDVDIRLNVTANQQLLSEVNPDVVVIATGSLPKVPQSFMESIYNIADINLVMADEVLEESIATGNNVLIIGGDQIGMQIADYLADKNKIVTVVEEHNHFAEKLAANDRWYLIARIIQKGVRRIKNMKKIEILPDDEVWIVTGEGRENLPDIDTIVLASERQSERSLAELSEKIGIETHIIGDAKDAVGEASAMIMTSIAQGYDLARQL